MAGNFQDVFVSDIYDRDYSGFDPVDLENVVVDVNKLAYFKTEKYTILWKYSQILEIRTFINKKMCFYPANTFEI